MIRYVAAFGVGIAAFVVTYLLYGVVSNWVDPVEPQPFFDAQGCSQMVVGGPLALLVAVLAGLLAERQARRYQDRAARKRFTKLSELDD